MRSLLLGFALVAFVFAVVDPVERNVLLDIYQSLGGANWNDHTNWLQDDPCDNNWYGVTCDQSGVHIESIDLTSNHAVGTLPPSMPQLPNLVRFYAGDNDIEGPIDPLCGLSFLQVLTMPSCELSGDIPQCLIGLQMLVTVDLEKNHLSGSAYVFFQMPNLQSLDVSNNNLRGTIPDPHMIGDIAFLDLGSNYFTGVLPALINLGHLVFFNASDNELTGPVPQVNPYAQAEFSGGNKFQCPLPFMSDSVKADCSFCASGHGLVEGKCPMCDPGTASDGTGPCKQCPADYYSSMPGMTSCVRCPAGASSTPGSAVCTPTADAAILTINVLFLIAALLALAAWIIWKIIGSHVTVLVARLRGRLLGNAPVAQVADAAESGAVSSAPAPAARRGGSGERQPILSGGSYGSM